MCRERERKKEKKGREWRDYNICILLCLMYLSGVCVYIQNQNVILCMNIPYVYDISYFVVEGGYQMKASRSVGGTQT